MPVVADEEGERDGEGEDSGADEVRAAERGQGLHGWALGPRGVVGAARCLASPVCVRPGTMPDGRDGIAEGR